jgi:hypothetical protein
MLNMERDGHNMSTDHLYENEVMGSNGDVISDLPRPLVAETAPIEN